MEMYELDRILTLKQAADRMGVSMSTLRRHYTNKMIKLSPRRYGIRMRDALLLGRPREDTGDVS